MVEKVRYVRIVARGHAVRRTTSRREVGAKWARVGREVNPRMRPSCANRPSDDQGPKTEGEMNSARVFRLWSFVFSHARLAFQAGSQIDPLAPAVAAQHQPAPAQRHQVALAVGHLAEARAQALDQRVDRLV